MIEFWNRRDGERSYSLTIRPLTPDLWPTVEDLYVRIGYRRKGVTPALIAATVKAAKRAKAPALEAYPLDSSQTPSASGTGYATTFARARFKTVACRVPSRRLCASIWRSAQTRRSRALFLVLILASGFFPALMRIMSSLVQLSANHPGRLIGLDCRFVSGLPDLSCRRIRVRMPLFSGFMRTAGAQGN